MSLEKLLGELETVSADNDTLSKALPTGDGANAAATEGGAGSGEGEAAGNGEGEGADAGAGEGEAKVVKALVDGVEVDAVDGTAMVKALTDRLEKGEVNLEKVVGSFVAVSKQQSSMIKSLIDTVKEQGEMLKALGSQPAGRRSVQNVKPAAQQPAGDLTPKSFMLKAQKAYDDKKINGVELSTLDVCLRTNQAPSQELFERVMAS